MLQPSKPALRLPEDRGSPLPQTPGGACPEDGRPWVASEELSLTLTPATQDGAEAWPHAPRRAACFPCPLPAVPGLTPHSTRERKASGREGREGRSSAPTEEGSGPSHEDDDTLTTWAERGRPAAEPPGSRMAGEETAARGGTHPNEGNELLGGLLVGAETGKHTVSLPYGQGRPLQRPAPPGLMPALPQAPAWTPDRRARRPAGSLNASARGPEPRGAARGHLLLPLRRLACRQLAQPGATLPAPQGPRRGQAACAPRTPWEQLGPPPGDGGDRPVRLRLPLNNLDAVGAHWGAFLGLRASGQDGAGVGGRL